METRTPLKFSTIEFDRFNIHTLVTPEFLQALQNRQDEISQMEREKKPAVFAALETARRAFHEAPNDQNIKEYYGEALAAVDAIVLPEFTEDYKKLAVYYAFQARVTRLAILYTDKYMSCLNDFDFNEVTYAECLSLSGYAQAMHPDYKNNDYFETAIQSFSNLLANETEDAKKNYYTMQIAFARRYLGLMARRRNDAETAQELFALALAAQLSLLPMMPQIKIDLGETQHLIGATYAFANNKEAAKVAYEAALQYEKEFVAATGAPHFLLGITGQSLGLLYGKLGDFNGAVKLLFETAQQQETFYGTREHADIAKTINFLAETYADVGMMAEAITNFIEALNIKEKFYAAGDPVLVITQKMLIQAFSRDFTFDWNDSRTLVDNEKKVPLMKATLARMPGQEILKLNANEKHAFGLLLYRLGSYERVHIASIDEEALKTLTLAKSLLDAPMEKALVDDQIALIHSHTETALAVEHATVTLPATSIAPLTSARDLGFFTPQAPQSSQTSAIDAKEFYVSPRQGG